MTETENIRLFFSGNSKRKKCLSISGIEQVSGMPKRTLWMALNKQRDIPEKHMMPLLATLAQFGYRPLSWPPVRERNHSRMSEEEFRKHVEAECSNSDSLILAEKERQQREHNTQQDWKTPLMGSVPMFKVETMTTGEAQRLEEAIKAYNDKQDYQWPTLPPPAPLPDPNTFPPAGCFVESNGPKHPNIGKIIRSSE